MSFKGAIKRVVAENNSSSSYLSASTTLPPPTADDIKQRFNQALGTARDFVKRNDVTSAVDAYQQVLRQIEVYHGHMFNSQAGKVGTELGEVAAQARKYDEAEEAFRIGIRGFEVGGKSMNDIMDYVNAIRGLASVLFVRCQRHARRRDSGSSLKDAAAATADVGPIQDIDTAIECYMLFTKVASLQDGGTASSGGDGGSSEGSPKGGDKNANSNAQALCGTLLSLGLSASFMARHDLAVKHLRRNMEIKKSTGLPYATVERHIEEEGVRMNKLIEHLGGEANHRFFCGASTILIEYLQHARETETQFTRVALGMFNMLRSKRSSGNKLKGNGGGIAHELRHLLESGKGAVQARLLAEAEEKFTEALDLIHDENGNLKVPRDVVSFEDRRTCEGSLAFTYCMRAQQDFEKGTREYKAMLIKSVKHYRRVLTLTEAFSSKGKNDPAQASAYVQLGTVACYLDKYDTGLAYFKRAHELKAQLKMDTRVEDKHISSVEAHINKCDAELLQACIEKTDIRMATCVVGKAPTIDAAKELLAQGRKLAHERRFTEAEDILQRAVSTFNAVAKQSAEDRVSRSPEYRQALTSLGMLYYTRGVAEGRSSGQLAFFNELALSFYSQSLACLEQMHEEKTDDIAQAPTLFNLGCVYVNLERYTTAMGFFWRCAEIKKRAGQNIDAILNNIHALEMKVMQVLDEDVFFGSHQRQRSFRGTADLNSSITSNDSSLHSASITRSPSRPFAIEDSFRMEPLDLSTSKFESLKRLREQSARLSNEHDGRRRALMVSDIQQRLGWEQANESQHRRDIASGYFVRFFLKQASELFLHHEANLRRVIACEFEREALAIEEAHVAEKTLLIPEHTIVFATILIPRLTGSERLARRTLVFDVWRREHALLQLQRLDERERVTRGSIHNQFAESLKQHLRQWAGANIFSVEEGARGSIVLQGLATTLELHERCAREALECHRWVAAQHQLEAHGVALLESIARTLLHTQEVGVRALLRADATAQEEAHIRIASCDVIFTNQCHVLRAKCLKQHNKLLLTLVEHECEDDLRAMIARRENCEIYRLVLFEQESLVRLRDIIGEEAMRRRAVVQELAAALETAQLSSISALEEAEAAHRTAISCREPAQFFESYSEQFQRSVGIGIPEAQARGNLAAAFFVAAFTTTLRALAEATRAANIVAFSEFLLWSFHHHCVGSLCVEYLTDVRAAHAELVRCCEQAEWNDIVGSVHRASSAMLQREEVDQRQCTEGAALLKLSELASVCATQAVESKEREARTVISGDENKKAMHIAEEFRQLTVVRSETAARRAVGAMQMQCRSNMLQEVHSVVTALAFCSVLCAAGDYAEDCSRRVLAHEEHQQRECVLEAEAQRTTLLYHAIVSQRRFMDGCLAELDALVTAALADADVVALLTVMRSESTARTGTTDDEAFARLQLLEQVHRYHAIGCGDAVHRELFDAFAMAHRRIAVDIPEVSEWLCDVEASHLWALLLQQASLCAEEAHHRCCVVAVEEASNCAQLQRRWSQLSSTFQVPIAEFNSRSWIHRSETLQREQLTERRGIVMSQAAWLAFVRLLWRFEQSLLVARVTVVELPQLETRAELEKRIMMRQHFYSVYTTLLVQEELVTRLLGISREEQVQRHLIEQHCYHQLDDTNATLAKCGAQYVESFGDHELSPRSLDRCGLYTLRLPAVVTGVSGRRLLFSPKHASASLFGSQSVTEPRRQAAATANVATSSSAPVFPTTTSFRKSQRHLTAIAAADRFLLQEALKTGDVSSDTKSRVAVALQGQRIRQLLDHTKTHEQYTRDCIEYDEYREFLRCVARGLSEQHGVHATALTAEADTQISNSIFELLMDRLLGSIGKPQ